MTGFDDAVLYQDILMFKNVIEGGADVSAKDMFDCTPIFNLRSMERATKDEFVEVLRAFIDAGADVNSKDLFGNTLLLVAENDDLGVALVEVGAAIDYEWQNLSKRGLANAAVSGCTRTIDAMVISRLGGPHEFKQKDFDTCLDRAARALAGNGFELCMSGITKLLLDYGANVNKWNTLHHCLKVNVPLVSTLIAFGADTAALVYDFERGVLNTPLHRVAEIESPEVFQALVANSTHDFNARDESGSTPLMALMTGSSRLLYQNRDERVRTRFDWLVDRGASCLPSDHKGRRVSEMTKSKSSPFKELIAGRVRDENWEKRRGLVMVRQILYKRLCSTRSDFLGGHDECTRIVKKVAGFSIEGIFRHIVTFV